LALALAALTLAPLFSGCSFADFYNQRGEVNVELVPIGPTNTSLAEFRSIKIAIYGVTVEQFLVIDRKQFSFAQQPLVIDLVEKGTRGETVPLVQNIQETIRPIDNVTLHLDVLSAIDAQGKPMPVCHEEDQTTSFPCFFVTQERAYPLGGRNFAVPRGGTLTLGVPLAVQQFGTGTQIEYSLFVDPSIAVVKTSL
jgi:hypothetical protein